MKLTINIKLLIIAATFNSTSVLAGPFGLEMGMTLDQIDKSATMLVPGKYKTKVVPKPHTSFENYLLQISPKHGLCWIKAIGNTLDTSTYGIELKSAFNEMREKLRKNYGASKLVDTLLPGSIWNEPNDWMMGLIKKERILISKWDKESGASLKENLKYIGLIAKANDPNSGYIIIEYGFTNEDACDRDLAEHDDDAL